MTLTLELTPEQEANLNKRATAVGLPTTEYVLRLIADQPQIETFGEKLKRHGIVPIAGTPREDGRAWSEIEGFE